MLPRQHGSINASAADSGAESVTVKGLRPPPGTRIRRSGAGCPASPAMPRALVAVLVPEAVATGVIPPWPIAVASPARQRRRRRHHGTAGLVEPLGQLRAPAGQFGRKRAQGRGLQGQPVVPNRPTSESGSWIPPPRLPRVVLRSPAKQPLTWATEGVVNVPCSARPLLGRSAVGCAVLPGTGPLAAPGSLFGWDSDQKRLLFGQQIVHGTSKTDAVDHPR